MRIRRLLIALFALGTIGGYGSDGANGNLRDNADANVIWQYSLGFNGPAEHWQKLETTIGPAGSGAALTWPAGILSTGMTFWISGENLTLYVDDLTLEQITLPKK